MANAYTYSRDNAFSIDVSDICVSKKAFLWVRHYEGFVSWSRAEGNATPRHNCRRLLYYVSLHPYGYDPFIYLKQNQDQNIVTEQTYVSLTNL